jgi:nicotinamide mononucleotide (NMN) deamidase PncC
MSNPKSDSYKKEKYKAKYINLKKTKLFGGDKFEIPTFGALRPTDVLNSKVANAHEAAYNLIAYMMSYYPTGSKERGQPQLQIATSESLTAGLMFSTLVDIPWGGYLKYGCFGVYDTNAKRVFNGVSVDDVYTHRCAKQMAVGILLNSNATIGLAVTGNAMPLNEHATMLGEVFIGVAGYGSDDKIIVKTKNINGCKDYEGLQNICKLWYEKITIAKAYNDREITSIVSNIIRNYTTEKAFEFCLEFIKDTKPIIPEFIIKQKDQEEGGKEDVRVKNIPAAKYPGRKELTIDCIDDVKCDELRSREDILETRSDLTLTNELSAESFKGKKTMIDYNLRPVPVSISVPTQTPIPTKSVVQTTT